MNASVGVAIALLLVVAACSQKERTPEQEAIEHKAGTTAEQREFAAKMAEQAAAYYQKRRDKARAAADGPASEVDQVAEVARIRPLLEAMSKVPVVSEPCKAEHVSQSELTVVQREVVDVLLSRSANAFPELLYNELNSPPVLGLKRVTGGKAMHSILRSHIESARKAFADPIVAMFEASELAPAVLDISAAPQARVTKRAAVSGTLTLFRVSDAQPLCAVKVAASVRAALIPSGTWTESTKQRWQRNDLAQTFWDGARRALEKHGVQVTLRASPDTPPDVSSAH